MSTVSANTETIVTITLDEVEAEALKSLLCVAYSQSHAPTVGEA